MKSKTVTRQVFIEKITIPDKDKPMFRAKRPTQHIIQIVIQSPGLDIVVSEKVFENNKKALDYYRLIRDLIITR